MAWVYLNEKNEIIGGEEMKKTLTKCDGCNGEGKIFWGTSSGNEFDLCVKCKGYGMVNKDTGEGDRLMDEVTCVICAGDGKMTFINNHGDKIINNCWNCDGCGSVQNKKKENKIKMEAHEKASEVLGCDPAYYGKEGQEEVERQMKKIMDKPVEQDFHFYLTNDLEVWVKGVVVVKDGFHVQVLNEHNNVVAEFGEEHVKGWVVG